MSTVLPFSPLVPVSDERPRRGRLVLTVRGPIAWRCLCGDRVPAGGQVHIVAPFTYRCPSCIGWRP